MTSGREPDERTSHALVLTTLRQAGEAMTVQQVAETVHLSVATARFHLRRLEASGLIRAESEQQPRRPGRPRVMYTARPPEAVDAGAAYRLLADVLAEQLMAVAGPDGARVAGHRWADRIASGADSDDRPDAADRIVRLLDETGFTPALSSDRRRIELHTCPFMSLARDRADTVCTVHLGLIQGLLAESDGAVRVRPVLDGSGPCVVELPAPVQPPLPRPRSLR